MPDSPDSKAVTIAYFISGHGYGHAVRSTRVINACPDIRFCIISTIEKAYFDHELDQDYEYFSCELDCGCVQANALEVDIHATYERYAEIEAQREDKIAQCLQYLQQHKISMVISDIAPLAFPIAKELGVPSLAISNFTWLEIYQDYVEKEPRFSEVLNAIKKDYSLASVYARLKPGMKQHPFTRVQDVSLLCRNRSASKAFLYQNTEIPEDKKIGLIYIGQYGLADTHWQKLAVYEDWIFVGVYPLKDAPENYLYIDINNSSVRYSDLVAHCDLIIAKLGYGIVSESLFWKKPIAYPPRKDFSEFQILEAEVLKAGNGIAISMEQLRLCELDHVLKHCSSKKHKTVDYDTAENSLLQIIQSMLNDNKN